MDMVAKFFNIFPTGKKQSSPKETTVNEDFRAISLITDDGWTPPWLDSNHVRLVLFLDHEGRGKIPLFDTKQYYQKTPKQSDAVSLTGKITDDSITSSSNQQTTSSLNSRLSHSRAQQSSDSQMLGEMMFGSMPLKLAGNSVKIHYIKSQQQLILTKLFTACHRPMPTCRVGNLSDSCPVPVDNCYNGSNSSLGATSDYGSSLLKVPSLSPESDGRCRSSSFNRSFLCPSPSASLPVSLGSSYNQEFSCNHSTGVSIPTSSLNSSLTRRLHRARSTSLENATHLYHRVLRPMDQGTTTVRKGKKYAIGLVFSLLDMRPNERRIFQEFFFSHFTLISSHLERLREKIEETLSNRRLQLSERIAEAYNNFVHNFMVLYCTQRIKAPVWLSVIKAGNTRRDVCRRFLSEFVSLAMELDNRDSRYFLSTILTSVLSLHLAWMFTVTKNGHSSSRHDKMASKSLAVLPDTHPYNPLWAQLGDLYGAVTDPLIISRTIVTGSNVALIHRLLYILTYFIRCSVIEPNSLFELKKSLFEESGDKNHESRAASTVTVTEDATSNSIRTASQRADLPLIKPHPFSFGLNSASSSLHSSSITDSITDIPKGGATGGDCHDNGSISSTSSLRFQTDLQKRQKEMSICTRSIRDDDDDPQYIRIRQPNAVANDYRHKSTLNHSTTANGFNSVPDGGKTGHDDRFQSYTTTTPIPHCIRSITSSDSCVSEPATDSGQFSDMEMNHRGGRECVLGGISVFPNPHSLPVHCTSLPAHCNTTVRPLYNTETLSCASSHDKLHGLFNMTTTHGGQCDPHSVPGIKITTPCDTLLNTEPLVTSNGSNRLHSDFTSPSTTTCKPAYSKDINSRVPLYNTTISPIHCHHNTHTNNNTPSPLTCASVSHCSSSPNMREGRESSRCLSSSLVTARNKSWTGLPLLEGAFQECEVDESCCNQPGMDEEEEEDNPITLKIDVEESLSAASLQRISSSPSDSLSSKGMKYAKQFQDFSPIDISRCTVIPKNTDPTVSGTDSGHKRQHSLKSTLGDFGHSLMAGYCADGYVNDFVLHGTSQPFSQFRDSLIMDLSNIMKNSIVDVPVQHTAAIVIDTDSLSCKLLMVSKSPRTPDGEVMAGSLPFSASVHDMIRSVSFLWKMQMGPEFCLSHLEDRLMELSDRSQMLSSAVLEKPESLDLSLSFLQQIHSTLNIPPSDQQFLQALACVHCSNIDRDISNALQTSFIHSLATNLK